MIPRFNLDSDSDMRLLTERVGVSGDFKRGALPRRTLYGRAPGIKPFGEEVDKLVDEDDFKSVIERCHEEQIFPVYHQRDTWAPAGFQWNQDGLGYCWTWGLTAALMDCRAREGKPIYVLSPVSLGWLVNWKDEGNYLEDAIRGARERGICEMSFTPDIHSLAYRKYLAGWEENALKYRLGDVWDLDNRSRSSMIQHSVSVLATGTPIYIAYNWWGHALECCGVKWDSSEKYSMVWQIRNSHDENDIIELTGDKGVFDEAYGICSTLTITE